MFKTMLVLSLAFALTGCRSLLEMAYDEGTGKDTSRCNAIISQPDRQYCLARVREVEKQAAEARKAR
jgi:hypothetical protein